MKKFGSQKNCPLLGLFMLMGIVIMKHDHSLPFQVTLGHMDKVTTNMNTPVAGTFAICFGEVGTSRR